MQLYAPPGTVASCSAATNPSPETARGVFTGIREFLRWNDATDDADFGATSFAIQGAGGSVGSALLNMLWEAGARNILVSEKEGPEGAARLRKALEGKTGIEILTPGIPIMLTGKDIFVPCAAGGILNAESIKPLDEVINLAKRPILIAGCANNQLATPEDGDRLYDAGVMYAPDYIINAGGLAEVFVSEGLVSQSMSTMHDRIGKTLRKIFETSDNTMEPHSRIADALVRDRVAQFSVPR
jgi:leucine dehydrogenase